MGDGMKSFLPTLSRICAANGTPIIFEVGGFAPDVWGDPDFDHPLHVIELTPIIIPDNATLEQAVMFFGGLMMRNIFLVYETHVVPEDIVWVGSTTIGLSMN
jgi:hypothetical protein